MNSLKAVSSHILGAWAKGDSKIEPWKEQSSPALTRSQTLHWLVGCTWWSLSARKGCKVPSNQFLHFCSHELRARDPICLCHSLQEIICVNRMYSIWVEFGRITLSLRQNGSYSHVWGIHLHHEMELRIRMHEKCNWNKSFLELYKWLCGLRIPLEFGFYLLWALIWGEPNTDRVPKEVAIEIGESKEMLQFLDWTWFRLVINCCHPVVIHLDCQWCNIGRKLKSDGKKILTSCTNDYLARVSEPCRHAGCVWDE